MVKNHCDCLVLPSQSEGFGRVAVEALYFDKKVIMTTNSLMYELYPQYDLFVKICSPFSDDSRRNVNDEDVSEILEKMEYAIDSPVYKHDNDQFLNQVRLELFKFLNIF